MVCFWHKHDCGRFVWPSSNIEYWIPKINRNVERDEENNKKLTGMGWKVPDYLGMRTEKECAGKTIGAIN